jgi:uncharacterized protein YecE (DUF72 family)
MGGLYIGTCGWAYAHWIGPFYPPGCRSSRQLEWYAQRFDSVELDATFYGLPKPGALAAWRDGTPEDFVFACKASRYLTHYKKLLHPEPALVRLLAALEVLGGKLGPVLFQLPPRWRANPQRLRDFLAVLPQRHRYVFEFRDPSWFCESIFALLEARGAACCAHDFGGRQAPIRLTADFAYIRLHGPQAAYRGSYGDAALAAWARRIRGWRAEGKEVYCYFDNDEQAYAVRDAQRLLRHLAR